VALYPYNIGRAGACQTTGGRCHAADPLDRAGRQHPLRQLAHSMMELSLSLERQSNLSEYHQEAVSAPNFTAAEHH
jgi:hypothetical protein